MADYANLQAAIDAGIANMTVNPTRNNVKNDDGTDAIATGITWFYFNSVQVTNLYASGNSWIGLGTSSEQLRVNRRDAAVWYEYTEAGMIGTYKFLKLRWIGYSSYSQTTDAYAQGFDVFLLDNGQIYLNFYDVPASSCDGTNALVCGSSTITYAVTAGAACEYTFTPADAVTGTGWNVASGRPNLAVNHKTSGNAVYTITGITGAVAASSLSWTESKPDGTTVVVSVSTDGVNYAAVTNGGALLASGTYDNQTVYIKVEMSTADATVTPSISGLNYAVQTAEDTYSIVLEMSPLERFESAAGDITVAYDGNGTLAGEGGPVESFSISFAPSDLVWKGNQNDQEHISITCEATGSLIHIYYTDASLGTDHIDFRNIVASGVLTNVSDI